MSQPTTNRRRTFTTAAAYAVESAEPKRIHVEVIGDMLTFRHYGSRRRYNLPIDRAMQEAIIDAAVASIDTDLFTKPNPKKP